MKNFEDMQKERKTQILNTRKMFTAIALLGAAMSLIAAPTRTGASSQDDNQPLESPLGIGLLPPSAQFPEQTWSVTGFRFNLLAGHHCDVFAHDIGTFINIADGDMFGLEVAGLYIRKISDWWRWRKIKMGIHEEIDANPGEESEIDEGNPDVNSDEYDDPMPSSAEETSEDASDKLKGKREE